MVGPCFKMFWGPPMCNGEKKLFYTIVPSRTRKYTALHKADTKLDSRCRWVEEKAEITGSVLQCLVGSTISTFVSNLYTFESVMVTVFTEEGR